MDPRQAGFCNDLPKPSIFPIIPAETFYPSPTRSFRPKVRFSALLPALHILKDAYKRSAGTRWLPVIQSKREIDVMGKRIHSITGSTEGIMHPNSDPFSRARIPYLECIPSRTVKTVTADLVTWGKLGYLKNPWTKKWKPAKPREEFERQLELTRLHSKYPYQDDIIPKVRAVAEVIFQDDVIGLSHPLLAARLLEYIQHGYISMDAVYITGQLLELSSLPTSPLSAAATTTRHFHLLGRRLLLLNATFGHAESIFQNIRTFKSVPHHAIHPQYHWYREHTLHVLESIAAAYPDTRVYGHMIALECTKGGNLDRARRYCLLGLDRPTRPKGYEMTLIYAAQVLPDYTEAMKALRLAVELLMYGIHDVPANDPFPFATIQRWVEKYTGLTKAAAVLLCKAREMTNSSEARELAKFRAAILTVKKELMNRLRSVGIEPDDAQWRVFSSRNLDDILFELLDPEAVLEEAELMRIRTPVREEMNVGERDLAFPFTPELIADAHRQRPLLSV